jgi:hypothetical protein
VVVAAGDLAGVAGRAQLAAQAGDPAQPAVDPPARSGSASGASRTSDQATTVGSRTRLIA